MSLHSLVKTVFKDLDEDHFKILEIMIENIEKFEVIPIEYITEHSTFDKSSVEKLLRKLNLYKLVWAPKGKIKGYILNYNGLDFLALKKLVDRNILEGLGKPIGVGKEADVYEGFTPSGEECAVKFFRIGRTSFRSYGKRRSTLTSIHSYLHASIEAARFEIQALKLLYPRGVAVPEPIAREKHTVITKIFRGIEIPSAQYINNPEKILREIIVNIWKAYEANVVHSDLSVYNILVTPTEDILIIDWPQWVERSHPMASTYLKRDLKNLLRYFSKRWKIRELSEECREIIEKILKEILNIDEYHDFLKGVFR